MKLEIKEKKENKLLGRLEIEGLLDFEGAIPSKETVKDFLAIELKADKNLLVVNHLYPKFSHSQVKVLAYLYQTPEMKEKMKVMTKHLKKKEESKKQEKTKNK